MLVLPPASRCIACGERKLEIKSCFGIIHMVIDFMNFTDFMDF